MKQNDIIESLRKQQEGMLRKGEFAIINRASIIELLADVDGLRMQRDELQREICRLETRHHGCPKQIALERGWDCFKEEP